MFNVGDNGTARNRSRGEWHEKFLSGTAAREGEESSAGHRKHHQDTKKPSSRRQKTSPGHKKHHQDTKSISGAQKYLTRVHKNLTRVHQKPS